MKIFISPHRLFALGFVLLVATNIIVLSGVASNRSGEPESKVTLTERELQLPYQVHEENSSMTLRLVWQTLGKSEEPNNYAGWRTPAWLDTEKLEELGFGITDYFAAQCDTVYYKAPIPREVFIVLENGGEPYKAAVDRAEMAFEKENEGLKSSPEDKRLRENFERAEKRLKRMRITESRLFAIDAGLDPEKLRLKYGDRSRFIITRGIVKPTCYEDNNGKQLVGYITELSVENIHVPLKHRQVLDSILAKGKPAQDQFVPPRYKIELAYGSRLEPWIISVDDMNEKSD